VDGRRVDGAHDDAGFGEPPRGGGRRRGTARSRQGDGDGAARPRAAVSASTRAASDSSSISTVTARAAPAIAPARAARVPWATHEAARGRRRGRRTDPVAFEQRHGRGDVARVGVDGDILTVWPRARPA